MFNKKIFKLKKYNLNNLKISLIGLEVKNKIKSKNKNNNSHKLKILKRH
jgi:hypothetical protein